MQKFLIILEQTKTGYSAYAPDLAGCVATGRNKAETEKNIYEAIKFHLEGMKAEGIKIPAPKTESEKMVFAY